MEPDRHNDREKDRRTGPGIPRPGQQPDQQQDPNAPPQPDSRESTRSSLWIPPTTGNPDLDPAGSQLHSRRIDLREPDPLTPQGMIYDPRQLTNPQRQPDYNLPPGARFDPFGPPGPDEVGPGRGPTPSSFYGEPDPDHFQAPGMPQLPRHRGKNLSKMPWPPGPRPPGPQF